jgi:hypothetical protein
MGLIKFNSADGFIDIFYPLLLKLSLKQDWNKYLAYQQNK